MRSLALAVLLALVAHARPADACSFAYEPAEIWPKHGATDVPLNARITVRLLSPQNLTVTLEDGTGASIPLTFPPRLPLPDAVDAMILIGTPASPLAANTTYTITARDEFRPDVRATFTTGVGEDHTPPAFAGISSVAPETMTYPLNGCTSSCVAAVDGHLSRMHIDFPDMPADVAFAELHTRRDDGVEVRQPLPRLSPKEIGFSYGGYDSYSPALIPGGRTCVRIIAYDVAGNPAGGTTEVCANAAICPPRSMYQADACTPSDGCSEDAGYDPFAHVDPGPAASETGGCASSRPDGLLALAMTAMSWICLRRRRGRRLMREIP